MSASPIFLSYNGEKWDPNIALELLKFAQWIRNKSYFALMSLKNRCFYSLGFSPKLLKAHPRYYEPLTRLTKSKQR